MLIHIHAKDTHFLKRNRIGKGIIFVKLDIGLHLYKCGVCSDQRERKEQQSRVLGQTDKGVKT